MAKFGSPTTPQDYEIPMALPDTVQDLAWSPTSNLLVDGAWDNNVRNTSLFFFFQNFKKMENGEKILMHDRYDVGKFSIKVNK